MTAPGAEALSLRIGLATGHLISRMGDFYGGTVNLASRLTAIARPGSTLVDAATEGALDDPEPYVLRHLAPRPLRGMGLVRATSVSLRRRAPVEGTGVRLRLPRLRADGSVPGGQALGEGSGAGEATGSSVGKTQVRYTQNRNSVPRPTAITLPLMLSASWLSRPSR